MIIRLRWEMNWLNDRLARQRTYERLDKIFDPRHPLRKDDVIWVLDFVKSQIAAPSARVAKLNKERLLENFRCFAEVAMLMVQHQRLTHPQGEQLKHWLYEACHGLYPRDGEPE